MWRGMNSNPTFESTFGNNDARVGRWWSSVDPIHYPQDDLQGTLKDPQFGVILFMLVNFDDVVDVEQSIT